MAFPLFHSIKQALIIFGSLLIFCENVLVLFTTQVVTRLLFRENTLLFQRLMDFTKNFFLIFLTTALSLAAPSSVRITTENESIPKGTFYFDKQLGRIASKIGPNALTICNHQIYTDWVYLWWLSYTSDMGGRVYIMLKKSLQAIPILGLGMTNFKFFFMNRKWAEDKINLMNGLRELEANCEGNGPLNGIEPIASQIDGTKKWKVDDSMNSLEDEPKLKKNNAWPYNFFLFPEGTNLTQNTRNKSAKYAKKVNRSTFNHLLLPHVTGLRFTLQNLSKSLDFVYDVTIGYSGVKSTSFAASHYSFKQIFVEGKYPKIVDMHIRAFKIEDIPLEHEEQFTDWLFNVWKEKDMLLDEYYMTGSFVRDSEKYDTVIGKFDVVFWESCVVIFLPILTISFIMKFVMSYFI